MSHIIKFQYGPDGIPFRLVDSGGVVDGTGRIPFHGIISRGLLDRVEQAAVPFPPWEEYGHLLHDQRIADWQELSLWRRTAGECSVLRFAQSAVCVQRYVEQYVGPLPHDNGSVNVLKRNLVSQQAGHYEVWNVKEGHTSSVWRVRLDNGSAIQEFAVNVARDRMAGEELARISEAMQRIAESWPEANLARVLDIVKIRLPDVAEPVVVTRNEWIPESYEIHRLPGPGNEPGPLVVVERFLTEDSAPSRIRRILGRRLTEAECEQVNRNVREFLERTARLAVRVDINEGDLVWTGQRAIVVAIR
jgi:hypothetical protein